MLFPLAALSQDIPAIAMYGGTEEAPVELLQTFDAVIVEHSGSVTPRDLRTPWTSWIAAIPLATRVAVGNDFENSGVEELVNGPLTRLWDSGFRGFYFQLQSGSDGRSSAVTAVIRATRAKFPHTKILLPDLPDVLPAVHNELYVVVSETLRENAGTDHHGLNPDSQESRVKTTRIKEIKQRYGLSTLVVDACKTNDRQCMRSSALAILGAGAIPYVSDPSRSTVGVGRWEVMPRTILVVQDGRVTTTLDSSKGVRYVAMPLNYLGYRVEYADLGTELPEVTTDRHAGIVVWLERPLGGNSTEFYRWLRKQIEKGVKVVILNSFGVAANSTNLRALGLENPPGRLKGQFEIIKKDSIVGFETGIVHDPRLATPVRVGTDGQSLLRVRIGDTDFDGVAITAWGGFALAPYAVLHDFRELDNDRWVIEPISFFRRALRLPSMPIPDVTTENGRRLLTVHVDGDGFASRAEMPEAKYAGQVLLQEIFDRYKIPMTMSVIEGEVSPKGVYPQASSEIAPIAREIFRRSYVEIASHTYSHPFQWHRALSENSETQTHLPIPGYRVDLHREIQGSIDYINKELAPSGKSVRLMLWPGDTQVPAQALKMASAAGVYSLNGGDTITTKSNLSWTGIAPLGIQKEKGAFQVFAPNQNENVYTNLWKGPYYGFRRVIETFEITDRPYRFKPINIYYHSYSGTKVASLSALRNVYDYALAQQVLPVHSTDYIKRVLDWQDVAIARELKQADEQPLDRWRVRGRADLNNLRWDGEGRIGATNREGVLGTSVTPAGGQYIHISDGHAEFSTGALSNARPRIEISEANAIITHWKVSGETTEFDFNGYYKPWVNLSLAEQCNVQTAARQERMGRGNVRVFSTPVSDLNRSPQHVRIVCR
ncbi:polysaccharide deacetylase family protein [Cupriavidus pauculus]|uniref:polysaccharide deacetylase family protein n=1 Tax=Cupriavidus pauculus TaxID=82633 RepID=UPI001FD470B1|nr:polysaccharide deacetylase family protein [Cupriavidus pauculus]